MKYRFSTGLEGKNAIEAFMDYDKRAGGYAVFINVGDMSNGFFGWIIDSDYFNYYAKNQVKLIVPCGRRSAKKEQEANELMENNALDYVREFAVACEAHGAPHMEIKAA